MAFALGLGSAVVSGEKPGAKRVSTSSASPAHQRTSSLGGWGARRSSVDASRDVGAHVLTTTPSSATAELATAQTPASKASSPGTPISGPGMASPPLPPRAPSTSSLAENAHFLKQLMSMSHGQIDPQLLWSGARTLHTKVNGIWQSLLTRVNNSYTLPYGMAAGKEQGAGAHRKHTPDDNLTEADGMMPPSAMNLPSVKISSSGNATSRGNSKAGTPRHSMDAASNAARSTVTAAATLQPFLTVADQVEVSYASMLADLCDLAYDVHHLTCERLQTKHNLALIATSSQCALPTAQVTESIVLPDMSAEQAKAMHMTPETAAMQAEEMLMTIYEATLDLVDEDEVEDDAQQVDDDVRSIASNSSGSSVRRRSSSNNIVPFTKSPASSPARGNSPSLTPSVSMLELSTPEAVTAALTSAGNAFSHPVYVSDLHHALSSMGTFEEDLDEDYTTAMPDSGHVVVGSPKAGRSGRTSPRSMGSPRVSRSGGSFSGTLALDSAEVSSAVAAAVADASASASLSSVDDAAGNANSSGAAPHGHLSSPPVVLACADKAPPAAWFCADDAVSKTRYFVIQGSSSVEHWQINLQFEPMTFEHASLGVRIHRGVYEAAMQLYDDMLPLVQSHLASSPYATIGFTGHSLGGSLGTVIMLLLVLRGVVKPNQISPAYTFGAPAIFCQGAAPEASEERCSDCQLECEMRPDRAAAPRAPAAPCTSSSDEGESANSGAKSAPSSKAAEHNCGSRGLLSCLGLSEDHVVNVIMHKDIVPRAFVCDYGSVAGVLQRWWPSFKDHSSLQPGAGPHQSLYSFLGRVAILRPHEKEEFVLSARDVAHPMLPNRAALYRVALPEDAVLPFGSMDGDASTGVSMASFDSWITATAATMATWDEAVGADWAAAASAKASNSSPAPAAAAAGAAAAAADGQCPVAATATATKAAAAAPVSSSSKWAASKAKASESLRKALAQFMNQPHPLTTLSDYSAYGDKGAISRYHNPNNYARALLGLLHM